MSFSLELRSSTLRTSRSSRRGDRAVAVFAARESRKSGVKISLRASGVSAVPLVVTRNARRTTPPASARTNSVRPITRALAARIADKLHREAAFPVERGLLDASGPRVGRRA